MAPFLPRLWFAVLLEFCGGRPIFLGLFTRPVAFVLCGKMAAAGAGPASLDCWLRKP